MPYMDSVNKFIWRVCLPSLAIFYVAFLAYEYFETKKGIEDVTEHVDKKAIKIAGLNKINSLILGGSNADFSLSAEILTTETNYKWFNLALGSEAHKDSNYWSYIESSLPENRRLNIENIVYSSVTLLGKDRINKRKETTKDKYGNQTSLDWFPNALIPNKSIAFYLKEFLLGAEQSNQRHRVSKKLGDFDMSQWTCDFKSSEAEFTGSSHLRV
ncbi:hypothetical protein [Marinospirillum insulare]|uniref:Uncharacterized protein n=2 Tax=Marinospirillum insulare TaxID=217169 RepID=A0ABQ5ZYB5_9GAMM|nr:hypothetical protein [Marinospirillum insulare]GLR64078.1 hypothetical protein GCM10007878_15160 [Marinospirillum insulare]